MSAAGVVGSVSILRLIFDNLHVFTKLFQVLIVELLISVAGIASDIAQVGENLVRHEGYLPLISKHSILAIPHIAPAMLPELIEEHRRHLGTYLKGGLAHGENVVDVINVCEGVSVEPTGVLI